MIGLAAAYAFRHRQHTVTVIDRGPPGGECSRGNAGWVVPFLSGPLPAPGLGLRSLGWMLRRDSPLHVDLRALPGLAPWLWRFWRHCNARDYAHGLEAVATLNGATMRLFDAWAADGVAFEMHQSGLLVVFLDRAHAPEAMVDFAALEDLGYAVPKLLTGDALRAIEPDLSEQVTGGFLVESERHVRPESLTAGLARRVEELGVTVRSGVGVLGAVGGGRVIRALRTSEGELAADRFLIAAGAWSGRLAATMGAALPVEAGKGYSITVADPALSLRRPLYFGEAKIGVSPFRNSVRVAGTMELSGMNTRLHVRRLAALRRSAERYLRVRPAWERGEEWVGLRAITPDGLPLIGRLPGYDNVYVATGHGMLGVTLAPATAELVADLMDGCTDDVAASFDPARFARRT
ncbi:MAG: FAD-dependent oxidoreductase [Gemmatimonadetes bacterium]|nr:FAD-dependent oxidoreductase [Gemmatimonadota bacterium]